MRWEDERYVRMYTRDTIDWLGLSFIAQGLFCLLLRKVDRAGLLKLGKVGKRGVAIIVGFPGDWQRLEPALEELLADGCVQIRGEYLVVPNFIEAQEAVQSDAQRKRESRARSRDLAAAESVLNPDNLSGNVTDGHESGQKVTPGHAASREVTPSLAVPSLAEPAAHAETLAEQFRRGVSDAMARMPPYPWNGSDAVRAVQAAIERAGGDVGHAVEWAAAKARDAKRLPHGMGWFAKVLEDLPEPEPAPAPVEPPRPGVVYLD